MSVAENRELSDKLLENSFHKGIERDTQQQVEKESCINAENIVSKDFREKGPHSQINKIAHKYCQKHSGQVSNSGLLLRDTANPARR